MRLLPAPRDHRDSAREQQHPQDEGRVMVYELHVCGVQLQITARYRAFFASHSSCRTSPVQSEAIWPLMEPSA